MSTGLPRPGLARSAHRGRIKFLRGYVSISSAAVNRPTHDHAASLSEVARTSMRSAFRGPAHQLAVRMRINNCTHGHYGPSNQPCTSNCTSAEGLQDLDTYLLRNLIRPRCAERAKPGRGKPVLIMHIGFLACFHAVSLERSRFSKIATLFFLPL